MEKGKKPFKTSGSSIVDLKAELFRKQQEFANLKGTTLGSGSYIKGQKSTTATESSKKLPFGNKKNKGVEGRAKRDEDIHVRTRDAQEEQRIEFAKKQLEAKSKLYDKLKTSGDNKEDEFGNSLYLVDFEQKFIDDAHELKRKLDTQKTQPTASTTLNVQQTISSTDDLPSSLLYDDDNVPDGDKWVDYTDDFGRSRRCLKKDLPSNNTSTVKPDLLSEDMKRELLRQKWEAEQQEMLANQDTVHYSNVKFDEKREHGVGFYQFSKDEERRRKEQEELEKIRGETISSQNSKQQLKTKRSEMVKHRLEKIRARRIAQGKSVPELPTGKERSDDSDDDLIGPPAPKKTMTSDPVAAEPGSEESKKVTKIREWDLGKPGLLLEHKTPAGWINPRNIRDEDFAPPSFYYKDGRKPKTVKQSAVPRPVISRPDANTNTDSNERTTHDHTLTKKPSVLDIPLPVETNIGHSDPTNRSEQISDNVTDMLKQLRNNT